MTRATSRTGLRAAVNLAAALAVLAIITLAVLLSGCGLPELAGGSSSTETGEKVALTGRVMNGNHPVPGVAVTLARAGVSDTTDATGTYRLIGRTAAARASAQAPDTLRFEVYGSVVTAQSLTDWTDGLPDLQVVQRGFSGMLLGDGTLVGRLMAVLTGDGLAGDSATAEFYHNTLADNYSGFLYFSPPGDTVRNYAVRVDVYDPQGHLVGRSQVVTFNSLAGNITLPAFDPGNLAGSDTTSP